MALLSNGVWYHIAAPSFIFELHSIEKKNVLFFGSVTRRASFPLKRSYNTFSGKLLAAVWNRIQPLGRPCDTERARPPCLEYVLHSCNYMIKTQLFFVHGATAPSGPGPAIYRGFTITLTHHTRLDSSGRMIWPTQIPLPDNTQHSQETDIHAPGRVRTRNPGKQAVADPRLRPRLRLLFEKFYIQAASLVPQTFSLSAVMVP